MKKPISGILAPHYGISAGQALADELAPYEDSILEDELGGKIIAYTKLLRDPQVHAAYQQLTGIATAAEQEVYPGGTGPNDEAARQFVEDMVEALDMDVIIGQMMTATAHYGYGVAEYIFDTVDGRDVIADVKVRHPAMFRFTKGGKLVFIEEEGATGKKLPNDKFWLTRYGAESSGNLYGQGNGRSLYHPVFLKNQVLSAWVTFMDRFAIPTVTGIVPDRALEDESPDAVAYRRLCMDVLKATRQQAGVLVPESLKLELLDTRGLSEHGQFIKFMDHMNAAISKAILTQTMTLDDGSSRAQATVHESMAMVVAKSLCDGIMRRFNNGIIRYLVAWNFPEGTNPPAVWRKIEPKQDTEKLAGVYKTISDMGFVPDVEVIEQVFGGKWTVRSVDGVENVDNDGNADFAEDPEGRKWLKRQRNEEQDDFDAMDNLAKIAAEDYSENVVTPRIGELVTAMKKATSFAALQGEIARMVKEGVTVKQTDGLTNSVLLADLLGEFRATQSERDENEAFS